MNRFLTQFSACLALITAATTSTQFASAGHEPPVYCAADRYRDAVVDFERRVHRVRYVSDCDERLVDELEDSTSRLRSAARDCNRLDRLFERFAQTDVLHRRVEAQLFGRGRHHGYPTHLHELSDCWTRVTHAYRALVHEMQALGFGYQGSFGYQNSYRAPHVQRHPDRRPSAVPGFTSTPPRRNPDSFYRSEYTPTFRPETFGPRPALSPRTALNPQRVPTQRGPRVPSIGADLQRRGSLPPVGPRQISSRDDLRAALIGALLQRVMN